MTAAVPSTLPLNGLRVIECSHRVMGPTCGMVLGDLGYAEPDIAALIAAGVVGAETL